MFAHLGGGGGGGGHPDLGCRRSGCFGIGVSGSKALGFTL